MKNIGLVGYLRFGNFGDELFRIIYSSLLQNKYSLTIMNESTKYPWIYDYNKIKKFDKIILVGGDLINPAYLSNLYFNDDYLLYDIDIYLFNIGVATENKINIGVLDKLTLFLNHKNIKYISFRDKKSLEWINKNISFGNNIKINLFPHDIVFGAKKFIMPIIPTVSAINNNITKTVGIIIRATYDFNINYDKLSKNIIVLSKMGYKIKLIVAGINSIQTDDIEEYIKLINLIKNDIDYELCVPNSISDIIDYINNCDIIISKKFHACIIGIMLEKIVCSLNDETKFSSLFTEMNLMQNIINIDDDNFISRLLLLKKCDIEYLNKIKDETETYLNDIYNIINT